MSTIDRVYNYCISRARRVIENAFGIASARWKCLRTTMEQCPNTLETIVSAMCVLHNFCMMNNTIYASPQIMDIEQNGVTYSGQWRNEGELIPLQKLNERSPSSVIAIRDEFKSYFTSAQDELPWQYTIQ